jgi:hypothetical protein
MYELAALAVGVGLGAAWQRLGSGPGLPLVLGGALVTGLAVSSLSGELALSWGFLVFDIGQVVVAAACGAALARVVARRATGRRPG